MASKYEQAGVSIDAQDDALARIKGHVQSTFNARVLSAHGSFGGLFDASFPEMKAPVLVSSADGVGTKLRVATAVNRHDSVGQCLVNHCINDILVQGATPLFFMDYLATGALEPAVVEAVIRGMSLACAENGMALLGGELAEMPGFYGAGDYDVAGFIVGVVDRDRILGKSRVHQGQRILGLASSGLHTNGYSLVRKVVFEQEKLRPEDRFPGTQRTVADVLLTVHRCYFPVLKSLIQEGRIAAMAHITGGGLLDNVPRILPDDLDAEIRTGFPMPPEFPYLVEKARMGFDEAHRVFNMGVGMVLLVDEADAEAIQRVILDQGVSCFPLGSVIRGRGRVQLIRESTGG